MDEMALGHLTNRMNTLFQADERITRQLLPCMFVFARAGVEPGAVHKQQLSLPAGR